MVKFEINIIDKTDTEKVIGADVIVYDDSEDLVKKITVVDENSLEELREQLEGVEDTYLKTENLQSEVNKLDSINATELENNKASAFSKTGHTHSEYAPKSHTDTNGVYGIATDTKYGHVKTVNHLNTASNVSGAVLSAYQGKVLNDAITALNTENTSLTEAYYKNSLHVLVGRSSDGAGETASKIQVTAGSSNGIYARLVSDDPDFEVAGKMVYLYVNGMVYGKKTDSNGKTDKLTINLPAGNYMIGVYCAGGDESNNANETKILEVK